MAGIGDYILARQERADRINNAGKAAEFYVKANPEILGQLGVDDSEWQNMGAQDKASMVQGLLQSQAQQTMAARLKDYEAQAEQRSQMAADDQGIGAAVNRYANAPDVTASMTAGTDVDPGGEMGPGGTQTVTSRSATPDERFRYALGTPGLSGRAVPKLIDALSRYGQQAEDNSPLVMKDNPYPGVSIVTSRSGRGGMHVVEDPKAGGAGEQLSPTYTEDPITGSRALLYGKSAQPTGFNPAKAQPQIFPQHDDKGNLMGWSQLDVRGRPTWIPNRSGTLRQATDQDDNAIPGYYVDSQGKLHDTRSVLQKSLGTAGAPAPGTTSGSASSKYKTKEEVVTAFREGKLQRVEAAKILTERFGIPMK